jgi:hypothetical protein
MGMEPSAMDDVDDFERKLSRKKARNYGILIALGVAGAGFIGSRMWKDHAEVVKWRDQEEKEEREAKAEARKGAETPAERAALAKQLDALDAEAAARDKKFLAAIASAFAAGPPTGGECMIPIPVSYTMRADAIGTEISSRQLYATSSGRKRLADGYFPDALRSPPDIHDSALRYDLIVDATSHDAPKVLGAGMLVAGSMTGRALLWDSAEERVACFAEAFSAESSDSVGYETTTKTLGGSVIDNSYEQRQDGERAAAADLEKQVRIAISAQLRATN